MRADDHTTRPRAPHRRTTLPPRRSGGHAAPTLAHLDSMIRLAGVALPTGVRLHYAERGDPAGRAVLLLHGYSDSWRSFAPVLPLLPSHLRLVAPDLRGHGDSERPADGYTMDALADDALALLDALDVERATVVGHSMGSFVAQRLALRAPERVTGLALVASAPSVRRFTDIHLLEEAVMALEDSQPEALAAFAREFQESTIHAPVPPGFVDGAVADSRRLPARVWQALMRGMLATEEATDLGRHRIPTLLLWGDRDGAVGRAPQDALLAMLPSARLSVFPDTGHAVHWERPAEFARVLTGWMGGQGEGAGSGE